MRHHDRRLKVAEDFDLRLFVVHGILTTQVIFTRREFWDNRLLARALQQRFASFGLQHPHFVFQVTARSARQYQPNARKGGGVFVFINRFGLSCCSVRAVSFVRRSEPDRVFPRQRGTCAKFFFILSTIPFCCVFFAWLAGRPTPLRCPTIFRSSIYSV